MSEVGGVWQGQHNLLIWSDNSNLCFCLVIKQCLADSVPVQDPFRTDLWFRSAILSLLKLSAIWVVFTRRFKRFTAVQRIKGVTLLFIWGDLVYVSGRKIKTHPISLKLHFSLHLEAEYYLHRGRKGDTRTGGGGGLCEISCALLSTNKTDEELFLEIQNQAL